MPAESDPRTKGFTPPGSPPGCVRATGPHQQAWQGPAASNADYRAVSVLRSTDHSPASNAR